MELFQFLSDGLFELVSSPQTEKEDTVDANLFVGFQLECIQCTSPIRRVSHNWNYACLYGTLLPLPCQHGNESKATFNTCMSNLYTLGTQGNGGKQIIIQIYKQKKIIDMN